MLSSLHGSTHTLVSGESVLVCTTDRPLEDLYCEGLHREGYNPVFVELLHRDLLVVEVDTGHDYRIDAHAVVDENVLCGQVFSHGEDVDVALAKRLDDEHLPVLVPSELSLAPEAVNT